MIVVDTNVIVHLVINGRQDTRGLLQRHRDWAAPRLWRSEFRNVLATLLRAGSLELRDAQALLRNAQALMAGHEYEVPGDEVLALAHRSGCTACDCEFVALAQDLGMRLVTTDKALLAAFPDTAEPLPR